MRKEYVLISDPTVRAICIEELDVLAINTDPESKGGLIYFDRHPPKQTVKERMRLVK